MKRARLRPLGLGATALAPFLAMVFYFAWRMSSATHADAGTPTPPAAAAPSEHTPADFEGMAGRLRDRLAKNPDNIDDWVLLGRTLAAIARWPEAHEAFAQAIARRPDEPVLHVQLGEVLTLEANGRVTRQAAAEFARAPDDPRSRFYTATALAQSGDTNQAKARLAALLAEAPPQASWRRTVQDEIASLDRPAPASPTPASPDTASPDTASPDLASPLANLESRVRTDPQDAEAWLALARAYRASGDRARAAGTLAQAAAHVPANLDLLLARADILADGIKGDSLPPGFVATMRQVEALDSKQPDALWYLGIDAKVRGDSHAAAGYWRLLLTLLPDSSDEHRAVQQRLKSLP